MSKTDTTKRLGVNELIHWEGSPKAGRCGRATSRQWGSSHVEILMQSTVHFSDAAPETGSKLLTGVAAAQSPASWG